jgi:hypothetical protein
MNEKKFSCLICGRAIKNKGNCLPCNYRNKHKKEISNKEFSTKKVKRLSTEEIIKGYLGEDYYGDRLLLRRRQNQNPEFKELVLKRYGNICAFCKKTDVPLGIHHLNYNYRCKRLILKRAINRKRKVLSLSCLDCKSKYPSEFEECISSVVPLCWNCHKKTHSDMKKSTGDYLPPKPCTTHPIPSVSDSKPSF